MASGSFCRIDGPGAPGRIGGAGATCGWAPRVHANPSSQDRTPRRAIELSPHYPALGRPSIDPF